LRKHVNNVLLKSGCYDDEATISPPHRASFARLPQCPMQFNQVVSSKGTPFRNALRTSSRREYRRASEAAGKSGKRSHGIFMMGIERFESGTARDREITFLSRVIRYGRKLASRPLRSRVLLGAVLVRCIPEKCQPQSTKRATDMRPVAPFLQCPCSRNALR
jgi:hypothetical protein